MKRKPIFCKNHDKRGGVGKDAYSQELEPKKRRNNKFQCIFFTHKKTL